MRTQVLMSRDRCPPLWRPRCSRHVVIAMMAGPGRRPPPASTWTFCSAATTPIWLAVQDGAGAWTRVMPTGTTFKFDIGSRGGVAYVLPDLDESAASATMTNAGQPLPSVDIAGVLRTAGAGVATSRSASRSSALADRASMNISSSARRPSSTREVRRTASPGTRP